MSDMPQHRRDNAPAGLNVKASFASALVNPGMLVPFPDRITVLAVLVLLRWWTRTNARKVSPVTKEVDGEKGVGGWEPGGATCNGVFVKTAKIERRQPFFPIQIRLLK